MKNNSLKYLPYLAVIFLIAALFHFSKDCYSYDLCINYPYVFYVFLKFVVCSYFIYVSYILCRRGNAPRDFIIFCAFAFAYNPIVKLPLAPEQWFFLNLITILTIIANEVSIYKRNKAIRKILNYEHIPFETKEKLVWQTYKDVYVVIDFLNYLKTKYPNTEYKEAIEEHFTLLANEDLLNNLTKN